MTKTDTPANPGRLLTPCVCHEFLYGVLVCWFPTGRRHLRRAPLAESHLTKRKRGLPGTIVNSPFTIVPVAPSPALQIWSHCSRVSCS
jgi:hypothetical protein